MKFSTAIISILVLPVLIAGFLISVNFEVNTGEMLTLMLQLVWGIMVALGGGIIFLTKFIFDDHDLNHKFRKAITDKVLKFAFPLVIQTLTFIFLSVLYPARLYFKHKFEISDGNFILLGRIADSVLFSLIVVPAFASILVGGWCMYLSIFHKHRGT